MQFPSRQYCKWILVHRALLGVFRNIWKNTKDEGRGGLSISGFWSMWNECEVWQLTQHLNIHQRAITVLVQRRAVGDALQVLNTESLLLKFNADSIQTQLLIYRMSYNEHRAVLQLLVSIGGRITGMNNCQPLSAVMAACESSPEEEEMLSSSVLTSCQRKFFSWNISRIIPPLVTATKAGFWFGLCGPISLCGEHLCIHCPASLTAGR